MATKQYRLLRSNKESGPYTADQLIGLGLKPYDLVWLDGRSAAWRYPCEIDDLKAYVPEVEEQPFDRFFKKPGNANINNTPATGQPAALTTVTTASPKPRIRIRADWNQVVEPAVEAMQAPIVTKEQVHQPAKQMEGADANWQNAWVDWQKNQNAVEEAPKKGGVSALNIALSDKKDPTGLTKYKPVDDLNEPYTGAFTELFAEKRAKWNKYKGAATVMLLAIPVLGFCIWLGTGWHGDGNVTQAQTASADGNITPVASVTTAQTEIPANARAGHAATPKPKTYAKEVIPDLEGNTDEKPASKITKKPDVTATTALDKKYGTDVKQAVSVVPQQKPVAAPQEHYAFSAPVDAGPTSRSKVVNPSLVGASANNNNDGLERLGEAAYQYPAPKKATENAAPLFRHVAKQQKTDDFVSVEAYQPSSQNIQNVVLNVENVTDAPVDLVVIDVQYYDAYGKFKSGQTIYVKNIPADQTVKVKVPDNAYASKIKYKVSLVSVEQKGVYLVAD